MTEYGEWRHTLLVDGESFRADLIDERYARRAGVSQIYAIHGAPLRFRKAIVRASQVCDIPHTWRVKQCARESDVTEEIVEQGLSILAGDERERGAHIITFVAAPSPHDVNYEFLAAGAIRNKLTREYEDEQYPVISRAVVAPAFRGKGLGSLLVEHRLSAVQKMFSKKPKAIHFATESSKMLHAFTKAAAELGLTFVYIGDEQYETAAGIHTVHDYLTYMPWYQEELLARCDELSRVSTSLSAVSDFRSALGLFMREGIKKVLGADLEQKFAALQASLTPGHKQEANLAVLQELFVIRRIIGASDPVTASSPL
jgi:GNAT superfamily N-acetyltransferase